MTNVFAKYKFLLINIILNILAHLIRKNECVDVCVCVRACADTVSRRRFREYGSNDLNDLKNIQSFLIRRRAD